MASFPVGVSPSHWVLITLIKANGYYKYPRNATVGDKHSSTWVCEHLCVCVYTQIHVNSRWLFLCLLFKTSKCEIVCADTDLGINYVSSAKASTNPKQIKMLYTSWTKKLKRHTAICQNKVKKGRQTIGGFAPRKEKMLHCLLRMPKTAFLARHFL